MSRSIAAAFVSVTCIVVFVDSSMGAASDDQSEVLAIVKDYGTPAADRGIAVLGQALQGDKDKAALVFKTLEANRSIAADNVRVELLLWCGATFVENRPGKPAKGNPMSIEELGQRALPLLKHADPFVRGIAEFAVAARLSIVTEGNDYEFSGRYSAVKTLLD